MREKTAGILGGMGTEATLLFLERIVANTHAKSDQDHLEMLIYNHSKVPDRTAGIIGKGQSPLTALISGVRRLERSGADFIAIPCVSAHFFFEEITDSVDIPCLSILHETALSLREIHPPVKKAGILATTLTIQKKLFSKELSEQQIVPIVPNSKQQAKVMEAIYRIKSGEKIRPKKTLAQIAESLLSKGAEAIVGGCTEIPIVLGQRDFGVPFVDCLDCLAKKVVSAGKGEVELFKENKGKNRGSLVL